MGEIRSVQPSRNYVSLLVALILTGAIIVGAITLLNREPNVATVQIIPPLPTQTLPPTETPTSTSTPAPIQVYVIGAVMNPRSPLTLSAGSRVQDALAAAGGTTTDADLNAINLVQFLRDGDLIYVPFLLTTPTSTPIPPSPTPTINITLATLTPTLIPTDLPTLLPTPVVNPSETPQFIEVYVVGEVKNGNTTLQLPLGSLVEDAIQGAGGLTDNANSDAVDLDAVLNDGDIVAVPAKTVTDFVTPTPNAPRLININTATQEELETLPRIGPALAQRIIEYREANGPFQTIEALDNVSGIGESTLEQLRPLITVTE